MLKLWRAAISERASASLSNSHARAQRWMRRDSDDFNCVNSSTPVGTHSAIYLLHIQHLLMSTPELG
jgi:hypothetical protein